MKRLTLMMMVAAWAITMTAQTAREEINANKYVAGSNYLDYDRLFTPQALTPALKGLSLIHI